jgi:hypothetical protein
VIQPGLISITKAAEELSIPVESLRRLAKQNIGIHFVRDRGQLLVQLYFTPPPRAEGIYAVPNKEERERILALRLAKIRPTFYPPGLINS